MRYDGKDDRNRCCPVRAARAVGVLGTLAAALAIAVPMVPAHASEVDTILLAGKPVMRIRAGRDGASPVDRAEIIRQRLSQVLTPGQPVIQAKDITVRPESVNGEAAAGIYARDQLLVIVDVTLTEANGMRDPFELAQVWAENLRAVLPALSLQTAQQQRNNRQVVAAKERAAASRVR